MEAAGPVAAVSDESVTVNLNVTGVTVTDLRRDVFCNLVTYFSLSATPCLGINPKD